MPVVTTTLSSLILAEPKASPEWSLAHYHVKDITGGAECCPNSVIMLHRQVCHDMEDSYYQDLFSANPLAVFDAEQSIGSEDHKRQNRALLMDTFLCAMQWSDKTLKLKSSLETVSYLQKSPQ
jgi:hypothetical protein